jgi:hypothetical protein
MSDIGACPRCGSAPKLVGYYVEGNHAVDVRCTNSKCMNAFVSTHIDDWPRWSEPFITITSANPISPSVGVGDALKITDVRPWWLKVWHWLRFWKPRPIFNYKITRVDDATRMIIKPLNELCAGGVVRIDDEILKARDLSQYQGSTFDLVHLDEAKDVPAYCLHYDDKWGCTRPECDCREIDVDYDMGKAP